MRAATVLPIWQSLPLGVGMETTGEPLGIPAQHAEQSGQERAGPGIGHENLPGTDRRDRAVPVVAR